MKTSLNNLSQTLRIIILGLIIGLGTNYIYAAFSAPKFTPTASSCNTGDPGCDVPLNVGNTGQVKAGGLTLGSASGTTNGLLVLNGNVGIGVSAPSAKLDVAGTIKATGFQLAIPYKPGHGWIAPVSIKPGQVIVATDDKGNVAWGSGVTVARAMRTKISNKNVANYVEKNKDTAYDASVYRPVIVIDGDRSNFVALNDVSPFPGSGAAASAIEDPIQSLKLDGIGCASGWSLVGCWENAGGGNDSGGQENDTMVGSDGNSCVTNDMDQKNANIDITIACIRVSL